MQRTNISYATHSWNPVRGCVPVSAGCMNCWMKIIEMRFGAGWGPRFTWSNRGRPILRQKPAVICTGFMGDIFHSSMPDDTAEKLIKVAVECPQHIFLILTKRPERIPAVGWPDNVWLGVSVENGDYKGRLKDLKINADANNLWVSFEPIIGPVGPLDLCGISWVVVGGESGPGARTCRQEWVNEIYKQAVWARIPFYFKQRGRKWEGCCETYPKEFPPDIEKIKSCCKK